MFNRPSKSKKNVRRKLKKKPMIMISGSSVMIPKHPLTKTTTTKGSSGCTN